MTLVRKDYRDLAQADADRLISAFLRFKNTGNPQTGLDYDQMVRWHVQAMSIAHRGPAFLPWHREYLRILEMNLQMVAEDTTLTLPYWNWAEDTAGDSPLWAADFMGGNGRSPDGEVVTGPFAYEKGQWTLNVGNDRKLTRNHGAGGMSLPSQDDVKALMAVSTYDTAPWNTESDVVSSFRNRLEGFGGQGPQLHNRVHVWVGGTMLAMTSPNDPVFWLNHCNVDRLWAEWQMLPDDTRYQPLEPIAGRPGHGINEQMAAFDNGATVRSSLDFKALGYTYDTIDDGSDVHPDLSLTEVAFVEPEWQRSPYMVA